MNWSTACPTWRERIIAGQSLVPCPPLFPDRAEEALTIFKQLRVYDVLGQPTLGECCREWVFDLVRAIFGAYDEDSGVQHIKEYFVHVSKKNGKSSIAAGIMLTAAIISWRPGNEFLVLAPTIEVAGASYGPARWMIKLDDELNDLFHAQDHYRSITNRDKGSVLKVVAADKDTVAGKKAAIVLIDELWAFGEKPNAENMILEATGGQASKPEGFTLYLTTQSDKAPAGVFKKKLDYARGVRDGRIIDPAFMPILYEFPEKMVEEKAYLDPKNFYMTNPNLGLSVDIDDIQRKFRVAEEDGEESMVSFLAKRLNVQVGLVLRSQQWAGASFWEKQGFKKVTLDYLIERSEVIVGGCDGGGLDDLLGFAAIGRDKETREWLVWTRAWIHPIAMERRKSEVTKYQDFIADGDLVLVEVGQDIKEVGDIVQKLNESGLLDRIGVDPSGINDIVDEIESRDIEHDRVVGISQGWRLNGAIKTTERRLADGTMIHGGQPMMLWVVGNARVEPKGNAILITKQASGTGKIDPLMALFAAVALMAMDPEARGGVNIYENYSLVRS